MDTAELTGPIEVRFTSGIREMRRALSAINAEMPVARWIRRAAYALSAGGLGLMVFWEFDRGFSLMTIGLAVLLWLWLMSWMNAWNVVRGDHPLAGEQLMRIQDDGLHGSSGGLNGHFNWSVFTRFVETPEFLLLFQGNRCAVFVPWRALSDDTERARLRLLARRKAGSGDASPGAELPPPADHGVTVRFALQAADVADATTAVAYRTRGGLKSTLTLFSMMLAIEVGWFFLGTWHRAGSELASTLFVTIPILVMLMFTPLSYRFFAIRHVRRLGAGAEAEVRVTDPGVLAWNPRGSTEFTWGRMREVVETWSLFVFTLGAGQAVFLPKRVLTGDQVDQVRVMIRERVPLARRRGLVR